MRDFLPAIESLGIDNMITTDKYVRGSCPFHDDKHPSWSINRRNGRWICFSGCGSGNFEELLLKLGVEGTEVAEKIDWRDFDEPEEAIFVPPRIDIRQMTKTFEDRGFTFDMLKPFGIGYDIDRECMAIPVNDPAGVMVGCIWRQAPGVVPKYVNSPGLDRRHLLYGVDRIPEFADVVYVVEGPLNAVWLTAAGFAAVATLGAQFSNSQIGLLTARNPLAVVSAFDGDDAGELATRRLVKLLSPRLGIKVLELPIGTSDVQEIGLNEIQRLPRLSPWELF